MLYFRKYRKNRTAESCGGAGMENRKRVTEMTIKEIAHLAGVLKRRGVEISKTAAM